MGTIFRHALKRYLGQILGWGLSFGLIAFYMQAFYKPMASQQIELQKLFDSYGDVMLSFFGGGIDFLSPAGYMDFGLFSYLPIVAGIFAVLMGSGLLATDEEKGTLDLIMAHPVSRTALFWGRFLAFAVAVVAILTLTWLGWVSGLPLVEWDISVWALALPHISLLAVLLLFGALALLLSMVLPSRSLAASVAGGLMVVCYLVTSLARVNDKLEGLNRVLPLKYYQGGWALNGMEWRNVAIMVGIAAALILLAWARFERRDIRVTGERSWRLPGLTRRS